jgi:Asp-tRNA(Asn)/Glu-tRNA(Gln) amidotransferase A subunit family amidase
LAPFDVDLAGRIGGSVRLPADANGVYGGRPTTGAIYAGGMSPLAKTLDTLGKSNPMHP